MKKVLFIGISAFAASSLMAADTIADAVKGGKVSGYIGAMVITNTDKDATPAFGGNLKYETDSVSGISGAVAFNTTNGLGLRPAVDKTVGSLKDDATNLYEAYLVGQFGNTTAKIGRQELYTPLANVDDDNRIFSQSFLAGVLINKDIPDTTLIGAHVSDMLTRGQTQFRSMSEVAGVDGIVNEKGVSAAAVIYSGIPGLTLQAWDYYGHEMLNAIYLQADYKTKVGDAEVFGAAQYISEKSLGDLDTALALDPATSSGIDASYYGLKAGVTLGDATLSAAFSDTNKNTNAFHSGSLYMPWGGAWVTPFTSTMEEIPVAAGTKAWQVRADYDFKAIVPGLSAFTRYASYNRDEALVATARDEGVMFGWLNKDSTELDIDATYAITKELSARVRYANVNYDAPNSDYTQVRYTMIYKF